MTTREPGNRPMSQLQLALVTRRYWPLMAETEFTVANLSEELALRGHAVSILSSRTLPSWPARFRMRGCDVFRLPSRFSAFRSSKQFEKAVVQYAKSHAATLDGLLLFTDNLPSLAILQGVTATQLPVVAHLPMEPTDARKEWWQRWLREIPTRLAQPDRVIWATSQLDAITRLGAAFPQVHWIPNGVRVGGAGQACPEEFGGPVRLDPAAPRRRRISLARDFLSKSHPMLRVRPEDHLFVYAGRIDPAQGIENWIRAWPHVLKLDRTAKLWLIGEGKHQQQIWEQIIELDIEDSVVVGSVFDDLSDIYAAADLFLLGNPNGLESPFVLEAMNQQLPVVRLCDSPVATAERPISVEIDCSEPAQVARQLVEIAGQTDLLDEICKSARTKITKFNNIQDCADRYLDLIGGCAISRGKCDGPPADHIG